MKTLKIDVRKELLRRFSDGKWRSVDDMAYQLRDFVPDELAARALRDSDCSEEDRVERGRCEMVRKVMYGLRTSGRSQRKGKQKAYLHRIPPV